MKIMKKVKVVYNACYGGFGLSKLAMERLAQLGMTAADEELKNQRAHFDSYNFYSSELSRHDPLLVQVVEELGEKANGAFADLQIQEIHGSRYRIDEYDGFESVQEPQDIRDWIEVE